MFLFAFSGEISVTFFKRTDLCPVVHVSNLSIQGTEAEELLQVGACLGFTARYCILFFFFKVGWDGGEERMNQFLTFPQGYL